jgi:hypothetical protein
MAVVDVAAAVEAARTSGVLNLSSLGLTAVPPAILAAAPRIHRLDLSHNELSALPPEIGALRNLEHLWVNDNPLEGLPDEIEGCVSLRVVDLRDTLVAALPGAVGRLPALVELSLTNTRLDAEVQAVYARGGTLALLTYLNDRDARAGLERALTVALTDTVFAEAADSAAGAGAIAGLVADVMAEFPDNAELRTVIRNAGRLFGGVLAAASAAGVRERYTDLVRDNARKALAADTELALRAHYYDAIDVTKVERMVNDIMAHMPTLEDAAFLLEHVTKLLPKRAADVRGADLHAALTALRAALTAERAGATAALTTALRTVYPDRDPEDVAALASSVSALLKSSDDVRTLASDAGELFPPEFSSAKPKKIVAAFKAAKKEKGLE